MAERAAHLVDHVFPPVAVRQWVLSLPHRVRWRFGAALNLNVHVHALVIDGVFTEDSDGTVMFHPLPPPGDDEVAAVLAIISHRIRLLLRRRGVADVAVSGAAADPSDCRVGARCDRPIEQR